MIKKLIGKTFTLIGLILFSVWASWCIGAIVIVFFSIIFQSVSLEGGCATIVFIIAFVIAFITILSKLWYKIDENDDSNDDINLGKP